MKLLFLTDHSPIGAKLLESCTVNGELLVECEVFPIFEIIKSIYVAGCKPENFLLRDSTPMPMIDLIRWWGYG